MERARGGIKAAMGFDGRQKMAAPAAPAFFAARFGMLTDRYGVRWMVNYD